MLESQIPSHKFWFVISGEDYQGPLSEQELQRLLAGAAIARDSVVWHSGLDNWKAIDEFPEFQPYLGLLPILPAPVLGSEIDFLEDPVVETQAPEPLATGRATEERRESNEMAWRRFLARQRNRQAVTHKHAEELTGNFANGSERNSRMPPKQLGVVWGKYAPMIAVFSLAALGLGLAIWAGSLRRSDALAGIDGVSSDDLARLESAIRVRFGRPGAKAAVAVARVDDFAPYFVVAGNMNDGAKFTLQIEGIPETLVGRFRVAMHTAVQLKDSISKSPVFRQANGATYPLGRYRVRLYCESCPQPATVLSETEFFLGREAFAGEYQHQLSAYHAQLRKQAADELAELKQLTESLENQLGETESEFQRVLRLPLEERLLAWKKYDQRWLAFQEQLDAIFSHWTPEALDGAYYYSEFYSALRVAGDRVHANHKAQATYIGLERRDPSQAAKVDAETAHLKTFLSDLKAKIQKTSGLKIHLEGLPPRLGAE